MEIHLADENSSESLGTASLRVLAFLILTVLLTVLIVLQQRGSGAFLAEFSATHEREADHYLSGLLVADLLTSRPVEPLAFVREFALHFPASGEGWPGLYGLVAGVWFAVLSPATPAALLLPAVLAALLVVSAGWVVASWQGPILGVAVGAVLLALPLMREATIVLTLDLPVALLAFWAALAFGRFLRTGRRRWAALFAGLSAAALFSGPAAPALALLPPLVVAAGRRWPVFRMPAFWWAWGIVLLAAATVLSIGLPGGAGAAPLPTVADHLAPDRIWEAARHAGALLHGELGPVLLTLAGIGALFAVARAGRREAASEGPLALAILVLASFATLCLAPRAGAPFATLPLVSPLLVLAAIGAMGLFGLLTTGWTTVASLMVAMVLLLFAMPALLLPVHKPATGMDNVAQVFLAKDAANPLLLVGADAAGEGALVAAVAQRDRKRSSFVVRGSQALATIGADGERVVTAADLMHRLEELGIAFVAVDTSPPAQRLTHNRLLREAIAAFPDRFVRIAGYPRDDGTGEARLYALAGQSGKVLDKAAVRERLRRAGQGLQEVSAPDAVRRGAAPAAAAPAAAMPEQPAAPAPTPAAAEPHAAPSAGETRP